LFPEHATPSDRRKSAGHRVAQLVHTVFVSGVHALEMYLPVPHDAVQRVHSVRSVLVQARVWYVLPLTHTSHGRQLFAGSVSTLRLLDASR
jgi:hypothetical protein